MKIIITLFLSIYTINSICIQIFAQDYTVPLHKYITLEAYYLMKNSGRSFPVMEDHLYMNNGWDCDDPERSWQTNKISTGAYREDCEDVVFKHSGYLTTVGHFWDADKRKNGDFSLTELNGVGDYKNAYEKAYLYKNGNWYDGDGNPSYIEFYYSGWTYYFMYQNTLPQFYKDNVLWYEKRIDESGATQWRQKYVVIEEWVKQLIIWEILGRMCHLLQDQTVPAHAHGDVHPSECYEEWIGLNFPNLDINRNTAGPFIDPFPISTSFGNPVRFLYYIANQLGDHWPSSPDCYTNPPEWVGDNERYNNTYGEGTYPILENWYNELGTPPNYVDPEIQANWNLKKAIVLTASLMYWFAIEAGLEQINPIPTNFSISRLPLNGVVHKGTQGQIIPFATGPGHWFEFQYRRCSWPPPNGQWYDINNQLHGIYYVDNPSKFVVVNQNYNGEMCSQGDIPAPGYPINVNVRACSNGGCTEYLPVFLEMNMDYPPGGCPFVFSTNNDSVFIGENNILHKSSFPEYYNQDIVDKYLFKRPPPIINDKHVVVLAEGNNDIDYFDQIKLIAVDHSLNTKIAITEDNQIVLYDTTQILSAVNANKNNQIDITSDIQYINQARNTPLVTGDTLDNLFLQFEGSNLGTYAIITEMEQDIIHPYPVHKRWAGDIDVAFPDGSNFQKTFARRELNSVNVIPIVLPSHNKYNLMDMNIAMLRNFAATYIAIVPISYDGYTLTELPLNSGRMQEEIGNFNIDSTLLIYQDDNYISLDNSSQLFLYFDYLPQIGLMKRDFILEINGKYINDTSFYSRNTSSNSSNIITEKITLYPNYPNPFNPKTLIKFELPKQTFVYLEIYNAVGQLIQTLVSNQLSKGLHNVEFDGTNLSSGVYFYTIRTENYSESKKMVLIK